MLYQFAEIMTRCWVGKHLWKKNLNFEYSLYCKRSVWKKTTQDNNRKKQEPPQMEWVQRNLLSVLFLLCCSWRPPERKVGAFCCRRGHVPELTFLELRANDVISEGILGNFILNSRKFRNFCWMIFSRRRRLVLLLIQRKAEAAIAREKRIHTAVKGRQRQRQRYPIDRNTKKWIITR